MMMHVRIKTIDNYDYRGKSLHQEIQQTLQINTIHSIRTCKIYHLQGFSLELADQFAQKALIDPITETYEINIQKQNHDFLKITIAKKPGVMNPEVATLLKTASDLNLPGLIAADISHEYHFYGTITNKQQQLICDRLLLNKTIEHIIIEPPQSLLVEEKLGTVTRIDVCIMTDDELYACAQHHQWYLNLHELKTIQHYFKHIGRNPYDIEIETIAQTWSEHCFHKTFKAALIINGIHKKPLFTRLKETAQQYFTNVVSAFADNSGAFYFYEGHAVLGKVETHNSPSAIEPYGGAATGSGGVFRDIMGTGQGAQVIAATDIFCFAPPDLPYDQLPPGCLEPRYLLRQVVAGVGDYGNCMGIPTNNGSVHFHENFRAKPTVIVGAYGIMPADKCAKGIPMVGDVIMLLGGRTGRDGIHGATFSSGHMTASTIQINANAVQIGNPIEEKRIADAIISARDQNLLHAITDCGAGGLSSAIGEMAALIGATVMLEKVPLKYAGLNPWEIWISESQERMICAIAPANIQKFYEICKEYNVEATQVGIFTGTQQLLITYQGIIIGNLSMQFLHHGIPQQTLIGTYQQPASISPKIPLPHDWVQLYCDVLAHWNICSKEPIVRQYDHGVQGTSALTSFSGINHQGPNDAAILAPLRGKPYGLVISHGINPILMERNPYEGSWWAIVESLANLVAVGGDVTNTCLIDNFIWPCPDEHYLGRLDFALQACIDAMNTFKIPFISGKDSLSSTYRYPDDTLLHIPPVLCVSAFGKIPDVYKTISADFKTTDSIIVLVGELDLEGMGGSIYLNITKNDQTKYKIPHIKKEKLPALFTTVYTLINQNIVQACHDISEGGIAVALAEMCFGGNIGAIVDLSFLHNERADFFLFNETAGCFLIEIDPKHIDHKLFESIDYHILGRTTSKQTISIHQHNQLLFEAPLSLLQESWQKPMAEVFT